VTHPNDVVTGEPATFQLLRDGKAAVGLKFHSGGAALVFLGAASDGLHVIDRRRLELVREGEAGWAKQPYHAAEHLKPEAARRLVRRGVAAA